MRTTFVGLSGFSNKCLIVTMQHKDVHVCVCATRSWIETFCRSCWIWIENKLLLVQFEVIPLVLLLLLCIKKFLVFKTVLAKSFR